jgi:hypothetical protein
MLKFTLNLAQCVNEEWAQDVRQAVEKMSVKLRKHHDNTAKPFVYPDGVILEPCVKLIPLKQVTWDQRYVEQYRLACRKGFVDKYQTLDNLSTSNSNPQTGIVNSQTSKIQTMIITKL